MSEYIKQTQSAREREKSKTATQKGEDIAYTINHALVCAATDIIDPFVAAYSQKYMGKKLHTSFCNKAHDHGGGCSHHHDKPISFGGALKHWVVGEALGDLGAIPVTIALQRTAPGFMDWINHGMESVLGGHYMKGAQRAAESWAAKNHVDANAPEVKQYKDEVYRYEVNHFGQAAIWTVASVGLNIASQKWITGNRHPVSYLLVYKALGAGMSATLLIGGRAFVPEKFHAWDKWTSEKIFTPTTKTVAGLFGVDEQTVESTVNKIEESHGTGWSDKVRDVPDVPTTHDR